MQKTTVTKLEPTNGIDTVSKDFLKKLKDTYGLNGVVVAESEPVPLQDVEGVGCNVLAVIHGTKPGGEVHIPESAVFFIASLAVYCSSHDKPFNMQGFLACLSERFPDDFRAFVTAEVTRTIQNINAARILATSQGREH